MSARTQLEKDRERQENIELAMNAGFYELAERLRRGEDAGDIADEIRQREEEEDLMPSQRGIGAAFASFAEMGGDTSDW